MEGKYFGFGDGLLTLLSITGYKDSFETFHGFIFVKLQNKHHLFVWFFGILHTSKITIRYHIRIFL